MLTPLFLLAAATAAPPAPVTDLKLPPGFTATLYADNPLASDIYTMTIDDAGNVLVAGRGYVRVLIDDDGDGIADRAVDLIDGLKDGPMGLLAEGDSLFVVADGGLKRYRGYNGRDKLKNPETLLALKTSGEHDAHMVRRGSDGWLYLLCGNSAGVRKEIITGDRSPVKKPIAGALLRLSPDFKQVEVVADGFRNPYSFDFDLNGEPFTYDSDNERCVGLPWYEGCRFYHVVPGGNHGWRSPQLSQMWRKPPYFPDVVPPVCDTGRGSPTGVACYRHTAFPERYRGGFFLADWTFGRLFFVPLKPSGSSYEGTAESFVESTGTSGFAPTALAVHPKTGALYVSIGGRGTRGGVYRIAADKPTPEAKPLPVAKRLLDFDKDAAQQWLADCLAEDARTRRIALELLLRWWDKVEWGEKLARAVSANLDHPDRLTRAAAGRLGSLWFLKLGKITDLRSRLTLALEQATDDPKWAVSVATDALKNEDATAEELIAALRIIQLAYGDLTSKDAIGTAFEGYTFRLPVPGSEAVALRSALYAPVRRKGGLDSRLVSLELARTFAAVGCPHERWAFDVTVYRIVEKSPHTDYFHYLLALARTTDETTFAGTRPARALFEMLDEVKAKNVVTDRHWPMRLEEMVARFAKVWPDFNKAVLEREEFGQPEHALFAHKLDVPREKVAERFLEAAKKDKNYAWTPAVVDLLAALPREKTSALLDKLADQPHLADAVVRVLAASPREGDQPRLVAGVLSLDADQVRVSAEALAKLKPLSDSSALVAGIRALRRFPDEKPNTAVRTAVVALLQKHSGETIGADAKAWAAWLVKHDPAAAKKLDARDGFDSAAWNKRLAGIDWSKGDTARGRSTFTKATCAACHDGGRAVGPSLVGVSKRFGREDLLTAILQPSKDVSPRYRATRVVTHDDKAYTGIIVYEATDGVILQTGADTSVRIAGAHIASMKQTDVSLMPAGLLDKLTDAEIADLLAYLNAQTEPKPK
jgi:putative membrane-bound dehydrogenase-like protein